jgi:uncharacterized protein
VASHPALEEQAHRPWPIPSGPWVLQQTWHDLLFAHWPVPVAVLRALIPQTLTLDEYAGTAWLAVTPFWMSGVGFRHCPPLPGASRFAELNLRTYVTREDRPGVWFFSLDAGSRLAVFAARRLYGLPYIHARMAHHAEANEIVYHSRRADGTSFDARYGPIGPMASSRPGTLVHWLTERYCLYAEGRSGRMYRAEIQHGPWPLQPARAAISRNDLPKGLGIELGGPPALLHFSRRLDVVVWPRQRVRAVA